MLSRTATRLAWALWALTAALLAAAVVLRALLGGAPYTILWGIGWPTLLSDLLYTAVLATVGALIASRRPGNPLGWIFCGIAVNSGVTPLAIWYAAQAQFGGAPNLPGAAWAAWVASWVWVWGLSAPPTFVFLLFPNGRALSARWRLVAWVVAGAVVVETIGLALAPGGLFVFPSIANPLGVGGAAGRAMVPLASGAAAAIMLCSIAAARSMFGRLRRAVGEERQQLLWFAFATALVAAPFVVASLGRIFLPAGVAAGEYLLVVYFCAITCIPVAVGVAILRHRLYDIDVLIRRTLVYGVLTTTLAALYWLGVAGLQRAAGWLTGREGSALAVVATTLAIAALFQPLRRRLQAFIDRRFYRRTYDAARTLAAFGARLQDETDLGRIQAVLLAAVGETMQPAHAALWLPEPQARRGYVSEPYPRISSGPAPEIGDAAPGPG